MTADHASTGDDERLTQDDLTGLDGETEHPPAAGDGPITARELLQQALVDDEDPRFPAWLPLPGIAAAAGWAAFVALAQNGDFLATLAWPGIAIFALTTVVAWFGWQLEID